VKSPILLFSDSLLVLYPSDNCEFATPGEPPGRPATLKTYLKTSVAAIILAILANQPATGGGPIRHLCDHQGPPSNRTAPDHPRHWPFSVWAGQ